MLVRDMPTIYIDNKPYAIPEGDRSLLEACLSLGFNLPYFCWHPAMHSVGACRQCAVKVFKDASDTRGRIVMSCMTPARDGMRISIGDPEAAAFRASVVEWLMVNHPHDCPICDEGGECHLQDMTVMTGHTYRRYRFTKRTFRDQAIGPFVHMEMNRCIQCYRCVRFYRDYAGGRDFGVMGWHDHVFFGRHEEGPLESPFSGNLVEVCPTGVFTDKTFKKHFTRLWDLQTAPSVCVHCGLGCNVIPGERYGALRRVRARFNAQVNGYFLCDRGRYGYEFTHSDRRVRQAMVRGEDGALRPAGKREALERVARMLSGGGAIGIGSARAPLESNFALRALVGAARFFQGVSRRQFELSRAMLDILQQGPCRTPSLGEVESADAVFVLGEALTNVAPMLELAVRQAVLQKPKEISRKLGIPDWDDASVRLAVQQDRGPLFIATPGATKLDDLAAGTYRAAPDDLARLGFAVAHEIEPGAPPVEGLTEEATSLAARIARDLLAARGPLVIAGPSCGSLAVVHAAANVAWALKRKGRPAEICFTAPECNSVGLALLGGDDIESAAKARQDVGRAYLHAEKPTSDVPRASMHALQADTIIILENDLYRHMPPDVADALLAAAKNVIVIDHMLTPTAEKAHVVLPAAAFGEADGTFVNNEGRAQRFYKAFVPEEPIQDSWRWLGEMDSARVAGVSPASGEGILASQDTGDWECSAGGTAAARAGETPATLDTLLPAMAKALPALAPVTEMAPPAGFRMAGQRIPRQSHRYSGRTAMTANLDVHEPKPPADPDSPLAFSMEGFPGLPPAALLGRYWAPGWNSVQAINKFQIEVGGPLHGGDPGRRLIEAVPASEVETISASPVEPRQDVLPPYFADVPAAFTPRAGRWWAVPALHIFGSEELSVHAPGIAQLAPKPYVAIPSAEAERLGFKDGQPVTLTIGQRTWRLPLKARPGLPAGVAAVPSGLPESCGLELPAWAEIV